MKKIFLFIFIAALQLPIHTAQAVSRKQEHIQRMLDLISMGRTEAEIVALLSETVTLVEDKNVDMTDFCRHDYFYKIIKDILNYDAVAQRYTAYPNVMKKYVVEDCKPLWPGRSRMEFYFQRPYGTNEPYTLFVMRQVLNVEVSDAATAFEKYLEVGIRNRNGQEPMILNTSYHSRESETPLPVKMAYFEMTTSREYLLVADNGILIFPEFVYVDKVEMNQVMESVKKYKEWLKNVRKTSVSTSK